MEINSSHLIRGVDLRQIRHLRPFVIEISANYELVFPYEAIVIDYHFITLRSNGFFFFFSEKTEENLHSRSQSIIR